MNTRSAPDRRHQQSRRPPHCGDLGFSPQTLTAGACPKAPRAASLCPAVRSERQRTAAQNRAVVEPEQQRWSPGLLGNQTLGQLSHSRSGDRLLGRPTDDGKRVQPTRLTAPWFRVRAPSKVVFVRNGFVRLCQESCLEGGIIERVEDLPGIRAMAGPRVEGA